MDQVEFEPTPHWSATMLKADEHHTESNSQTKWVACYIFKSETFTTEHMTCLFLFCSTLFFIWLFFCFYFLYYIRETNKPSVLIKAGGGIYNYLYQLKLSSQGSAQMKVEGSNVLGKLQITWRANLGEPGRLQTQQILGNVSAYLQRTMIKKNIVRFFGVCLSSLCLSKISLMWDFESSQHMTQNWTFDLHMRFPTCTKLDVWLTWYILLQPITHKEIELHVTEVPSAVTLERPFSVQ